MTIKQINQNTILKPQMRTIMIRALSNNKKVFVII